MSQEMRRYVPLLIAGTVLIAAACSDSAIAPQQSTPRLDMFSGSAASASLSSSTPGSKTFTFTIDPNGGSVKIGGFRLDYDANAVCDPSTSGYGPEFWLADCSTLSTPIVMTVKLWKENGQSMADFSPNIRFSPNAQVLLSVKRHKIRGQQASDDLRRAYSITYFKTVDGVVQSFDESLSDSDVRTQLDSKNGVVWRRIRHFTGYYVRSGDRCDDSSGDAACTVVAELF